MNRTAGSPVESAYRPKVDPVESTRTINDSEVAEPSTVAGTRSDGLPLSTIFAYSMPSLVLGFSSALAGLYILKFATDVMLIAPGLFATMYAIARIWDGISDPIAGYLSDRTTHKAGRRRPWIALGSIPLAISVVILWSPPASLEGG